MSGFQSFGSSGFQSAVASGYQTWITAPKCAPIGDMQILGSSVYTTQGPRDIKGNIQDGKRLLADGESQWVIPAVLGDPDWGRRGLWVESDDEIYVAGTIDEREAIARIDGDGAVVWEELVVDSVEATLHDVAVNPNTGEGWAVGVEIINSPLDPTPVSYGVRFDTADGGNIDFVDPMGSLVSVLRIIFDGNYYMCGQWKAKVIAGDGSRDYTVSKHSEPSVEANSVWLFATHPERIAGEFKTAYDVVLNGSTVFVCGRANDDSSGKCVWAIDDTSTSTNEFGEENPDELGAWVHESYSAGSDFFDIRGLSTIDGTTVWVGGESDGTANLWKLSWNGSSFSVDGRWLLNDGATIRHVEFDGTVLMLGFGCISPGIRRRPLFRVDPADPTSIVWKK